MPDYRFHLQFKGAGVIQLFHAQPFALAVSNLIRGVSSV